MEVKLKLSAEEHKELVAYCNLNDLLISSVVKDSFTTGFNIERYGLLNSETGKETIVEKEVIKYVEVPKVEEKEVIKIEYIEVEKPVEVIKEVPVEKIVVQEVVKEVPVEKVVEKVVKVSDDTQTNELLSKIQQLENTPPKIVEVIKEVPVERVVIHEKKVEVPVEKIVEVPVEKIVEVIKEVVIEKEVASDNNSKLEALQSTIMKLRQDNIEKDKLIKKMEEMIKETQKVQEKNAVYLRGSNLDDKLYK